MTYNLHDNLHFLYLFIVFFQIRQKKFSIYFLRGGFAIENLLRNIQFKKYIKQIIFHAKIFYKIRYGMNFIVEF